MIDRWARLVARRARTVLVLGLLATIAAGVYGSGVFGSLSQGGFDDPGSESVRALRLERDTFGNQSADVVAVYSSPDDSDLTADDPEFRRAVADVVQGLPESAVAHVVPYFAAPKPIAPDLVSEDGHHAQLLISLAGESQDDYLTNYDKVSPVLEASSDSGLTTDVTGPFAVYDDVNRLSSEDLERAELISMPVVIVLALLIFGSLVAASMPALIGLVSMIGALAIVRLLAQFMEVSVFSVNVISLLGIGLAIDYALFVISRFREELAKAGSTTDAPAVAIERTLQTAGRTVLFSGLTVAAALASLLIFPQAFIRSMGLGGMAAVLVAMVAALTILPALLKVLGPRVDAGRLPWRRHRAVAVEDSHGRWGALAHKVMRRPVVVIAAVVIALLAVASPFLGVKWGSVDYRVLPEDAPAHEAAALLSTEFGPERSSASLVLRGADEAAVASYSRAVEDVDPTMTVLPVAQKDDVTLLRASWEGNSQTGASQQVVQDIRGVQPDDGEVLVGGLTANTVDLLDSVASHLPWMALIVVAVMLVLLFLAFGSVVLPIKAIIMNVFSITASFGVVTWIFSDGHLSDQLGFTAQGFLDATNPIVMLAILFGLSMDYEVFLLSRVREQWDATAGSGLPAGERNELAVATGVQKTGRIITSAALLLAVVIGAFSLSGIVFIKMLGIGMVVALLIDATIVRGLLVPATMKLLGGWNWWAPGPLARWWERHGFREERPAAPEAEREPALT